MKQISTTLIIALLLSFGFSACTKDKGNPEPEKEEVTLEGKWIGTEAEIEYYLDKTLVETVSVPKERVWHYAIFNPNKVIIKDRNQLIEADITVSKTTLVLKVDNELVGFEYLISGNKLTITHSVEDNGTTDDEKEYNNAKTIISLVKEE